MGEIKTDRTIVSDLTTQINDSISDMKFENKEKLTYSNTAALLDLMDCISALETTVTSFKEAVSTDVENIQNIHNYIEEVDLEISKGAK